MVDNFIVEMVDIVDNFRVKWSLVDNLVDNLWITVSKPIVSTRNFRVKIKNGGYGG